MNYKNIENLVAWLQDNMKCNPYDLDAVLEDIESQYGASGSSVYELASWETISGNPECYSYDVESVYNEEDDTYEDTFVF